MKLKIIAVFLFVCFSFFACAENSKKRHDFVIADSKSYEASLFRQNCAVCHGAEANGKETNGTLIPSLRYGEAATLSEQQIYTQIHDGKLPMPAFKNQLTDDEIKRLVKFIRHDLQGKEESKK
ncbi:MAG: c-type cytochrome [Pyrinomonadaceae bacterium]